MIFITTFPPPTLPNVDFRILRFIFMTYDYICVCVFILETPLHHFVLSGQNDVMESPIPQ